MKRNQLVLIFALVSFILSFGIGWQQQSAVAANIEAVTESPAKASQSPEPAKISSDTQPDANNLQPRISFEKTVCDLGDVGRGTKNTCEFKFTNTGQALLKIGKIKRTCGCTARVCSRPACASGTCLHTRNLNYYGSYPLNPCKSVSIRV